MDECRAMGLSVVPPDVNLSGADFTVAGDTMRFGLAAIKNVGATAIESIIALRGDGGPFRSLADFCARADLRMVNRRVIDSLIKAGALDSLKSTRAALLAGLDQAMEGGQRRQREREEGQGSLFEALGGGAAEPAASPAEAKVPEWPADQLLAYEKEVLGFYLSGHPLERHREVARQLGSVSVGELASRPVGARVAVLGQIGSVRERATKSGNRMAFATLEAVDGAVAVTIFPEALKTCGPALRSTGPVLVKGRIDDTDKGRVLLAEEITAIDTTPSSHGPNGNGAARPSGREQPAGGRQADEGDRVHAHTCRIRLRPNGGGAGALDALLGELRAACEAHRGATPVFLHVLLPEHEVVVKVAGCRVDPAPDLIAELERLLGQNSVVVEYAGRA
jgi:DNA polymerase-3 subunit alpha